MLKWKITATHLIVGLILTSAIYISAPVSAGTPFPGRGKLDGQGTIKTEYMRIRCYQGDGTACAAYAEKLFLFEEKSDFGGYRKALDHGCYVKKNHDCCERIKSDREEGDKIKAKCHNGDAESCATYADGLILIYGYDRRDESIRYLQQSCDLKIKRSCDELVKLGYPPVFELVKQMRLDCKKSGGAACNELDKNGYPLWYWK